MNKLIVSLLLGASLLATTTSVQAEMFKKGEGAFSWASLDEFKAAHPGLEGQTLSFWNPWSEGGGTGGDKDQWEAVLSYFADATGVVIQNGSSKNYEEQARIDIAAGSPANITDPAAARPSGRLRQAGCADRPGRRYHHVADRQLLGRFLVGGSRPVRRQGRRGPPVRLPPSKQEVKSLVWYSPDNFAEKGYTVPQTWEELMALQDKIVADGGVPWCLGIESGGATGWTATDWIEDIMLRTQPPDVYDGWVTNTIKFNDPRIVAAIDAVRFDRQAGQVRGRRRQAVTTTAFGDSPKGLFSVPPQCYMHRQASFIPGFFPEGLKVSGEDYNFFYLPASSKVDLGKPVLGSGNLVTISKDSPAARAFIDYIEDAARPRDLDGPARRFVPVRSTRA